MDREQDVVGGETWPGEHFDCEEVGTCQHGHVGGDALLPGGILAPLGCRLAVSAEDIAHRLAGNALTEIRQSSDDAVVSPAGVLSGEAHNEGFQFGPDTGPAWSGAEFRAVKFAAMSRRYQAKVTSSRMVYNPFSKGAKCLALAAW